MKNIFFLIITFAFIISFTSCTTTKQETIEKPTVMLHKPTATMYNSGDTVWIEAHYEDAEELHNYHLAVQNTTDSVQVFHMHGHSHSTHVHIDTFVVLTATAHTNYKVEAMASNHNSQSTTVTHAFHVMP